jgi:hypothetical protein
MDIIFENKQEQKQIFDILLNLGYKWHGKTELTTSEQIMERWGGSYNVISVDYHPSNIGDIQMTHESKVTNSYSWEKDTTKILSKLSNYKMSTPDKIRINGVGDYHATVYRDHVNIYNVEIPHEVILKVYNSFDDINANISFGGIAITTKNDQENKDLLTLLHSMGWGSSYRETLEEYIEFFKEFPSKVVYENGNIGGNYGYYGQGDKEYTMADLGDIYTMLSKKTFIKMDDIGDYGTIVYRDYVKVGCQEISKDKVEEIVDAITKIKQ